MNTDQTGTEQCCTIKTSESHFWSIIFGNFGSAKIFSKLIFATLIY